jgi:hypothetical protein
MGRIAHEKPFKPLAQAGPSLADPGVLPGSFLLHEGYW